MGEVQGHYCLTQFYGMEFTTDKLRSMVRKWQSLIEAHVDVKTTDGYVLRLFCIGYANNAQVKAIRKKMTDIMTREAQSCPLKQLVDKLIPESIGKEVEKACSGIYPLQNVFVRKVKMLKKPKFDLTKLLEVHADSGKEDTGAKVEVAVDSKAEGVGPTL